MSFICRIEKKVETRYLRFLILFFLSPRGLKKNEMGAKYTKYPWYGIPRVEEGHRRSSTRWDEVPIKFLRPVGKRTMAEGEHVAATRLVC